MSQQTAEHAESINSSFQRLEIAPYNSDELRQIGILVHNTHHPEVATEATEKLEQEIGFLNAIRSAHEEALTRKQRVYFALAAISGGVGVLINETWRSPNLSLAAFVCAVPIIRRAFRVQGQNDFHEQNVLFADENLQTIEDAVRSICVQQKCEPPHQFNL